jgi:hypothetical protein
MISTGLLASGVDASCMTLLVCRPSVGPVESHLTLGWFVIQMAGHLVAIGG